MIADLAYLLANAQEIDIIGIAPHPLVEAIWRVAPGIDGEPSAALAPIRYFTPSPQIVYGHMRETSLGSLLQRWNSSITAFDNLIVTRGDVHIGPCATYTAYVIDDLFVDCMIRLCNKDESTTVAGLMALPGLSSREPVVFWQFNEPPPELVEVIDRLTQSDKPLTMREVHCKPLDPVLIEELATTTEYTDWPGPEIKKFVHYGSLADQDFALPVAVVAIRANTPTGVAVFLKKRTPLTDRGDFGVFSLLSSRVLEEDLAIGLGIDLVDEVDDYQAFEQTWINAKKPKPFNVPVPAFFRAAQRELHVSCGLTVDQMRLKFRGFQVINHEKNSQQLCFAVFDLALLRSSTLDELRIVDSWNRGGMVRVDQERLYSDVPDELPLNRLLKARKDWLTEKVFSLPVDEV
jgi:hypothetical protein